MKYQQLENLECGWKWSYLVKKHQAGEAITRYQEASAAHQAVEELLRLENEPIRVSGWIKAHMNPALQTRLHQTIRARRKRHFNAENTLTRKKSIDLDYPAWQKLASLARQHNCTLSEMIVRLLEACPNTERAFPER